MKSLGTQHIAEFIDCNTEILNDEGLLSELLKEAIEYSGLNYVNIISHKFNPVGITVLAIISESHIGIHTYPEAKHISLDIFTCSDSHKQINLINYLKKKIEPGAVRMARLERGNPMNITDKNWITSASSYGFEIRYSVEKLIYSGESKFQQIDIIRNQHFGKMLFIDKYLQIAESDAGFYNKTLVAPLAEKKDATEILVLGGGDGGVLKEVLSYPVEKVTLVDIDPDVISLSRKYLPELSGDAFSDKRVNVIYEDAINYLKKASDYHAVIYDLTMHPEAFTRKDRSEFFDEIFRSINKSLYRGGVISVQAGSAFDESTLLVIKEILAKYFKNIIYNKKYIPSFCEEWIFATAIK